jgi:hypothetical protein
MTVGLVWARADGWQTAYVPGGHFVELYDRYAERPVVTVVRCLWAEAHEA